MEIKNRQITQRFGYSDIPSSHPKFLEQLEPNIKDSVIALISLGYKTTSSCQGHANPPFITLDKKTTDPNITKNLKSFFITCEFVDDFVLISGNRFYILSNTFLCKQIYQAVCRLPINTYNGDVQ